MQQASDLFYTMAVSVLKQKSSSKTLSSSKLIYPTFGKKKIPPRRVFFLLQDFGTVFFFRQNSPRLSARDLHFVGKASQEGFCTSRYSAGQRLCGEPRHGKGWVWPLTLDIASQ